MIFRGIQELLTLSRDYANPSEIAVRLDIGNTVVKISVQDNGRGFDVEAALNGEENYQDPRAQSMVTLKEKFELVRGSVSIISNEADGTTVRMELPVND